MNSITLTGNLGKDAEMRSLPDGTQIASFSVADSQGRDRPSIWWNCSIFGKRAEALAPYLVKGQPVTVVGSVTEREWSDKDGMKRKSMDVRVNDLALQGGRKDAAPPQGTSAPRERSREAYGTERPNTGFSDMDDAPF